DRSLLDARAEHLLHPPGDVLAALGRQVAVDAESNADVAVAEQLRHLPQRHARVQRQRGERVPQVMERVRAPTRSRRIAWGPLAQAQPLLQALPAEPQVPGLARRAHLARKDEPVLAPLLARELALEGQQRRMTLEHRDQPWRQW